LSSNEDPNNEDIKEEDHEDEGDEAMKVTVEEDVSSQIKRSQITERQLQMQLMSN
jgi:hypothetical protein